jgi:hypothetical protein
MMQEEKMRGQYATPQIYMLQAVNIMNIDGLP